MMHLEPKVAMLKTKIHQKIKQSKKLDKYGLTKCEKCLGFGLANFQLLSDGSYSWDGDSFCDSCKGYGYQPIDNVDALIFDMFASYVCRSCDGEGCHLCRNTGFIDWVMHARGA